MAAANSTPFGHAASGGHWGVERGGSVWSVWRCLHIWVWMGQMLNMCHKKELVDELSHMLIIPQRNSHSKGRNPQEREEWSEKRFDHLHAKKRWISCLNWGAHTNVWFWIWLFCVKYQVFGKLRWKCTWVNGSFKILQTVCFDGTENCWCSSLVKWIAWTLKWLITAKQSIWRIWNDPFTRVHSHLKVATVCVTSCWKRLEKMTCGQRYESSFFWQVIKIETTCWIRKDNSEFVSHSFSSQNQKDNSYLCKWGVFSPRLKLLMACLTSVAHLKENCCILYNRWKLNAVTWLSI